MPLFVIVLFLPVIMSAQTLSDEIRKLPSPERAQELGKQLLRDMRQTALEVAVLLNVPDAAVVANARAVLNEMEEAALTPLLQEQRELTAGDDAWRLTMVVETTLELRKAAARLIESRLGDTRAAPQASGRVPEEPEPPSRVCDDAYLLMQRLLASRSESQMALESRRFLRLTEARRNMEIRAARQVPGWRRLVE
jgi:hypothetical protein